MSNPLPKIVKDYRIAVANHVLCPGSGACDHDHAAAERKAAEAIREALSDPAVLRHHADQLAAALAELADAAGVWHDPNWKFLETHAVSLGDALTKAVAAYEAWREGPGATKGGGNG